MNPRTIAVIGAGPVGGILAAHLYSSGHRIVIVDAWKEHLECIRASGLRISGIEDILVRVPDLVPSVRSLRDIMPDFVFICTKACDLGNVLDEIGDALIGSNAVFISAQNGIDTEQLIARRVDLSRVLRTVITWGGVLVCPGEIRETFFNPPNYLGWLDESAADVCREVAGIMSGSGLATEATEEIQKHVWRKAILNTCTMPLSALTGMNMQEVLNFPPTNQLVELLLNESIAVAAAFGFDYGPAFMDAIKDFNKRAGPHKPSMLVDLENGRRTENAFLIRRIAEYGEQKGVPAPVHRTLANLIDAFEMRNAERIRSRQAADKSLS
jgi:2-dehydropantoate 2-reductase